MSEFLKKMSEQLTGMGRPDASVILVRTRKPDLRAFKGDGQTPNNTRFALIHYKSPVGLDPAHDPAAIFEELFKSNGWGGSWRDGIYDFLHFHTHSHEVLGIARGAAKVQFGGRMGDILMLQAGDVVILPAGTGHMRVSQSRDLLVVGAYPNSSGGGGYDEPRPRDIEYESAERQIAKVGIPRKDPVYGADAGLRRVWT